MEQFSNLEVVIKQVGEKYKATCDNFPKCSGTGTTQEEALNKLSESIARFISGLAKQALKSVLSSDSYSEVLLDTTSDKAEHRRVFSLDPTMNALTKSVFVKVDPLKEKGRQLPQTPDINDIFQAEVEHHPALSMKTGATGLESAALQRLLQENESDGFVFGFPINFN